jgi:hypothetical protein
MTIVSTARIEPAADLADIIRATALLPAERKAIHAAQEKLRVTGELASRFAGKAASERIGQTSSLQRALWDACDRFAATPSEAAAEALAQAAARWHASDVIDQHFSHAYENARAAISKSLEPVATALLERAAATMESQLATTQSALDGSPSLAAEARNFAARAEAARAQVAGQREALAKNPMYWLLTEIATEL